MEPSPKSKSDTHSDRHYYNPHTCTLRVNHIVQNEEENQLIAKAARVRESQVHPKVRTLGGHNLVYTLYASQVV